MEKGFYYWSACFWYNAHKATTKVCGIISVYLYNKQWFNGFKGCRWECVYLLIAKLERKGIHVPVGTLYLHLYFYELLHHLRKTLETTQISTLSGAF